MRANVASAVARENGLITLQLFADAVELSFKWEKNVSTDCASNRHCESTRTANTAPSFCSLRTVKKVIFSVSLRPHDTVSACPGHAWALIVARAAIAHLIFVSTSSRTNSLQEQSTRSHAQHVRRHECFATFTEKAGVRTDRAARRW